MPALLLVAQRQAHRVALALLERVALEPPRRPQRVRARRATRASAGCRRSWSGGGWSSRARLPAGADCRTAAAWRAMMQCGRASLTRTSAQRVRPLDQLRASPVRLPAARRLLRLRFPRHAPNPLRRQRLSRHRPRARALRARPASTLVVAQCKTEDDVIAHGKGCRGDPAAVRADHRARAGRVARARHREPHRRRLRHHRHGRLREGTASGSRIRPTTASARWRRMRWRWRWRWCATSSPITATSAPGNWHFLSSGHAVARRRD